jgi:hypothetical protein
MDESSANTSRHCPFLNRSDPRCQRQFSLDDLDHAFEFCFGTYDACPVYRELLSRRRIRQANAVPAEYDGVPAQGGERTPSDTGRPQPQTYPIRVRVSLAA